MTISRTFLFATMTSLMLAGGLLAGPAASPTPPDFKEVYDLLRAHLPDATDAALNQAAVTGLLTQLNGKASLVSDVPTAPTNDLPIKAAIVDQNVLYLRVSRITGNLADLITVAGQSVPATNRLAGTVLDLRFATGDADNRVGEAAGLLAPKQTPLLVLVNGSTSGAAEVLAAELRNSGALLIGAPTAGLAMTTEDFPLANGQRLRIATTPIKLNGAELTRLQPDISVKSDPAEERALMENPYGPAAQAGTPAENDTNNLTPLLDHTTEADLVRQKRKDGDGDENPEPPARPEPAKPVLRDPVLARAVDLVKGLAIVRQHHP
jgi:hypothetical protein